MLQFLLAKSLAFSIDAVLQDYSMPGGTSLTPLVHGALLMSASELRANPKLLASQLIGRLNHFIAATAKSNATPVQEKIRVRYLILVIFTDQLIAAAVGPGQAVLEFQSHICMRLNQLVTALSSQRSTGFMICSNAFDIYLR